MRKRQTNRRKYLLKRIFTCQKTESNEIGWQTAANTTIYTIYRGCKSLFGQINLHWQQAVPLAHNAKYAANKSKLTNTNSGGGVRVTSPRQGQGQEVLSLSGGTAWGHLNMQQQQRQHGAPARQRAESELLLRLPQPMLKLRRAERNEY